MTRDRRERTRDVIDRAPDRAFAKRMLAGGRDAAEAART
jgi:hypothetical protein